MEKSKNVYGTLSDKQIREFCRSGKLITSNFETNNIKQACYELRSSNIYYDLSDNNKKYELQADEYILIKPKQLVVIITYESLSLPKDILGRILTKGSLFSLGLIPVNTYADPGFYGKLGIVFNNLSNNYIKINIHESIAKIEFSKLQEEVESDYKGQHGYETQIWPIKTDNILTDEEIKRDYRIKDSTDELELSYGKTMSNVIRRVYKFERKLILSAIAYLIFSGILITFIVVHDNSTSNVISSIISIILGIVSNILFSLLTYFATNLNSKRK